MISIVVVSPVYEDFTPEFVLSLLSIYRAARARGWRVDEPDFIYRQGCLLVPARNELAQDAYNHTSASHVVWMDRDHLVSGDVVARMIEADKDIVGVSSPKRNEPGFVFVGEEGPVANGLMEVQGVGFGVLVMKREVIKAFHDLGQPMFRESAEDSTFCKDWRAMGGKVHLLLDAEVGHVGRVLFRGNLSQGRIETER